MTQNSNMDGTGLPEDSKEINLLEILVVLVRRKWFILQMTVVAAVLSVVAAFLWPSMYTGSASILTPRPSQAGSLASAMQLSGSIGSMASDALGLKDPNALYITMMKSRTIGEKLVTRFNLQEIYGREWQLLEVRPLKKLRQRTDIFTNKDGVIVIQVDDRDPQRAADLANAYIEEFNILLRTRVMTEAAARRQFFEVHSREEKDKLTDAQLLLDKTPTTSLDYLDAMRNFKYHEGVYEMLAKQFELAMLDEAKDLPMVEVLDKATKPEARSSPKRKQIVLLATLAGLILSVMWVFLSEVFKRQADDPEQAERMDELRRSFRWRRREKNAQGKA